MSRQTVLYADPRKATPCMAPWAEYINRLPEWERPGFLDQFRPFLAEARVAVHGVVRW
jgi:hypothetical protein